MGIFKQALNNDSGRELPYFYYIAATMCIGIKTYTRMQSYFSSPKAFYEAKTEKLEKLGIFTNAQLSRLDLAKKSIDPVLEYERMMREGIRILPYESLDYPERLKTIKDAPPVLFLKGKLMEKDTPFISVIGARECSQYGANVAHRLGEVFAQNRIALVSGMARGVDSISQRAAMDAGGYSIALLGGGVDVIYPMESRELYEKLSVTGGIMSEFPPGTAPKKPYFALRNRLISGLSDVVCVVEAKEKSGTMITVDCALEQGREVYAVPGRITDITSVGTNELIRQGAGMIMDPSTFVDEIMDRFSFARINDSKSEKTLKVPGLTDNEVSILKNLDENSFTAEQLSAKTSIPAYELLSLCIGLSAKGILDSKGAGRFVLSQYGNGVRQAVLRECVQ